uniref:Annexin n=1 Tax=Magallana gigas TaxID=29159 RepID=K1RTF1_MAGGI
MRTDETQGDQGVFSISEENQRDVSATCTEKPGLYREKDSHGCRITNETLIEGLVNEMRTDETQGDQGVFSISEENQRYVSATCIEKPGLYREKDSHGSRITNETLIEETQHSSNYPPANPYGGGYTSYGYGGGYGNPYQQNPAAQMMQGMMGMMMPAMHTMPPSTQTVVINNNVWNTNNALMSAAKVEELLAQKMQEDEDFMARLKSNYVANLKRHLDMDGTLEPTEGTVKGFTHYPEDDPMVVFMNEFDGTPLAGERWDAESDCIFLDKAMDGAGTNEDAIIHVIANRTNAQRQKIKKKFKTAYGEDLIERLDSELSGDFLETVMALFVPPAHYDAWCIKEAIYGPGTDESVLIEIFGTRTPKQIQEIRAVYGDVASPNRKSGETLIEQDIEDDTSGDFKRFLISACQGGRNELDPETLEEAVEPVLFEDKPTGQFIINMEKLVNVAKAKRDAQKLFEVTEDQLGTDEEEMIRIFALPEVYQSRATYDEYVKLTQRDVENTIDRETSGNFGKGLLTMVMALKCRPKYFAERLVWCMKGLGTHDSDLIRVIVSRAEIDMVQIKECFLEMTKQTLWNWIDQDCSGDYCKILKAIVGQN